MSTFAWLGRLGAFTSFVPLTSFVLLTASLAHAAPPARAECIEAHSKGQDAREAGRFVDAGKLFLTCAQAACPSLVQSDCVRFADELATLQPTVTFAARDGANNDLADTAVYVDGKLVASRLGEGKPFDIDPGRHEVRFVHAGEEKVVQVVANQGEKGRGVVGVFPRTAAPPSAPAPQPTASSAPVSPALKRPVGPLVLAGLGAAVAVAGGVLFAVGVMDIPERCSAFSRECAAPPGDPVFEQASRGLVLANVGGVGGGIGVLTLVGSLTWYFVQSPRPLTPAAIGLQPWIGPSGGGFSLAGQL